MHQTVSLDDRFVVHFSADVLDMPLPEHTYQRPLPPTNTASQSIAGYIGLPYQDHNYGMPPPPSPPRPASPRPPTPFEDHGIVQIEEEVKTTLPVSIVEEVVEDSVTRCICGYLHDDGYMICCDECSVWQHIDCMGVDRNNIPDSYFCELCQPRILDAARAKAMQKRKREELAARNVLSDSSATDTDPEEAANALASMGKKLPPSKKKNLKQKNKKLKEKEKPPLKLKIRKALAQKVKKPGKKEKENITNSKPEKKLMKSSGQKEKLGKDKARIPLTSDEMTGDPWNSNFSPWVDSYNYARENQYSPSVIEFSDNTNGISQNIDISSIMPDQVLSHLTCVAEVKKNRKGLKAVQEIPAGQAIIEYKGKVMLKHDYDKEQGVVNCFNKLQPFVLFYSQLDVNLCVDARTYGNEARFVRRSCTPNAEVKHILSQGKLYFIILSKKDIMCGFEVTIPFDYNYQDCSFCVECACKKNSCVVSRYWKKMKNSQKALQHKEYGVKRKRQNSGTEVSGTDQICMSPPLGSPGKHLSPSKTTSTSSTPKVVSPVKFSNVSTLLAASALLDGKLDLANSLDQEAKDSLQHNQATTQHKSATLSRRSSKLVEDSVNSAGALSPTKDKLSKGKDNAKLKGKEKDGKVNSHHITESKKERRLSSRRQSQDDIDDTADQKADSSTSANLSGTEIEESAVSCSESQKKMTREERKLDAIMKVFEKMEKREERRKEAMARGDQGSKRSSTDSKPQKKEDNSSQPRSTLQDESVDSNIAVKEEWSGDEIHDAEPEVKTEETMNFGNQQRAQAKDIKSEKSEDQQVKTEGLTDGSSVTSSSAPLTHEFRSGSLESSSKITRRPGKRKRRRSRAHSATVTSDTASVSAEEGHISTSSFPPAPLSAQVTPVSTPVSTPLPQEDSDGGAFKYVKTKKHLFDEWSHKHEDETKQEKFVECLPNPHVNTMDHLQRRNSQSAGSGHRGSEAGGGSAKKRWLRQAMHEVPAPVAFNHSLSVSTDSGSASPIYGSSSPNPGTGLGSPGAGSSLDFVTPLKKRRLIRESLSSEVTSPSAVVLAESFSTNGVGGMNTKTNGVKHMLPATRHSTDDRMFLHNGYTHKNGFREGMLFSEGKGSKTSQSNTSVAPIGSLETERQNLQSEQKLHSDSAWMGETRINGVAERMHVPANSLQQAPSSTASFPFKFRDLLDRGEKLEDKEAAASSSRHLQSISSVAGPVRCSSSSPLKQESMELDSSVSVPPVVVVNRSVFKDVNSLMGGEGSETGVTAKSIMNEDSPATVRIDLNAHEMEPPTSLSDSSSNVVVNLDDSLLSVSLQKEHHQDMAECHVNSSEDVERFPTRNQGTISVNICDKVCTNSINNGCRDDRVHVASQSKHSDSSDMVDSSQPSVPACDELVSNSSGSVGKDCSFKDLEPGRGSVSLEPADGISSSGQAGMPRVIVELSSLCDSANNCTEGQSGWTQDTGISRAIPVEAVDDSQNGSREEGTRADSNEDSKFNSVENGPTHALDSQLSADYNEKINGLDKADSNVAESSSTNEPEPSYLVSVVSMENNVDSTCSEARQTTEFLSESPVAHQLCDSNSDLNKTGNRSFQRSSVNSDDSGTDSMSVSSSEACASHKMDHSRETSEREGHRLMKCSDDSEIISSVTLETAGPTEQQEVQKPELESHQDQSIESSNLSGAENLSQVSVEQSQETSSESAFLSPLSTSVSVFSSSSVPMITTDNSHSPGSPSSTNVHLAQSLAGSSTASNSQIAVTSPISSSMEDTPVVKKKVSLLEYRKRLKEKPVNVSEAKTSTSPGSSAALTSSVSTPITHHKLSTTLSLYLQGSSPTSSFSSSSSTTSSKASALLQSSNHGMKKSRMPTLATLPLFKSSEPKREEKKKSKPKPEKQLSLTDRLRLEFGLEDVDEGSRKKRNDADVASSNGLVDSSVPPPPPPPLTTSYSASASSTRFGVTLARPVQGQFVGSSAPMLNGIRSSHFQQQPQQQQATISSTSLNLPPLMGGPLRHPHPGSAGMDQHHPQQTSKPTVPPPPPRTYKGPSTSTSFKTGIHHNVHHLQPSSSSSAPLSSSTGGMDLVPNQTPPPPPSSSWGSGMIGQTSTGLHAMIPQSSAGPSVQHGPPPLPHMQLFNQRQQPQQHSRPPPVQVHPKTILTDNIVPDDRPPPPPPPPPRLHHHHQSSTPSSSSNRFHSHQGSGSKHKNMAAASSSSHSSSSSSCYQDNRSRY
ncbi:histone-lysine N-methyltransferase 2E [Elysia marginata]|uniref:Histone-lysine N-methyltransferase 2E n=1 Tax=Elysia marginata TaxID=1093978 RepID=A0AAV4JPD2_9GAST|nr:histone-lysine N-methyltransferase 2E [Elysia marginata]